MAYCMGFRCDRSLSALRYVLALSAKHINRHHEQSKQSDRRTLTLVPNLAVRNYLAVVASADQLKQLPNDPDYDLKSGMQC